MTFTKALAIVCALFSLAAGPIFAQSGPLRIQITEGVIEPLPIAVPEFIAETGAARAVAQQITQVVLADLTGSGLFREIPAKAHLSRVTSFDAPRAIPRLAGDQRPRFGGWCGFAVGWATACQIQAL